MLFQKVVIMKIEFFEQIDMNCWHTEWVFQKTFYYKRFFQKPLKINELYK